MRPQARLSVVVLLVATALTVGAAQTPAGRASADLYSQLRWRYIGPEGNRVSAIAGVPGDPLTI
jgi:hypothetical protein